MLAALIDKGRRGAIVPVVQAPFEMLVRSVARLWIAALLTCIPAAAQLKEPISTWAALPNPAGTVSLKLDFVNPVGQNTGANTQAISRIQSGGGLGPGIPKPCFRCRYYESPRPMEAPCSREASFP